MKVHQHQTSNMLLRAPAGMKNCDTVPATMIIDDKTGEVQICTFWRPSEEELRALNSGHSVCLHVFGHVHAPVAMSVQAP